MGFSDNWDERYKAGEHQSVWPWSNLVSLVFGYTKMRALKDAFRVVEFGCGAGANIPIFAAYQADYHGLDGSPHTIEMLQQKFPQYKGQLKAGDFTKPLDFEGNFDLVVDRAAITHNNTAGVQAALQNAHHCLKPGGIFIGNDWFSTQHDEYRKGERAEDEFTRTNYREGPFANLGRVHFSSEAHMKELFKNFEILHLAHVLEENKTPHKRMVGMWQIVAKKR